MDTRIKELRAALGLSQQKFADKIGIARGNIGAYEVGKNKPSDAFISLFAKNLMLTRTGFGTVSVICSNKETGPLARCFPNWTTLTMILSNLLLLFTWNLTKTVRKCLEKPPAKWQKKERSRTSCRLLCFLC